MKAFRFAVFAVLLFSALPVSAQWTNVAPKLLPQYLSGAMTYCAGRLWAIRANKLWVSDDDGMTWSDRSPGNSLTITFDIDFFDANNGIIACREGLYITRDGGNTWDLNDPEFDAYFSAKFIASSDEIVVTSVHSGVIITRDGGATWNHGLLRGEYTDIKATRSGVIYTAALCSSGDCSRIATSTDYGATWSYLLGMFDYDCWSFVLDPCDDKRFYVVNEELLAQTDNKPSIYVSSDRGASWQITSTSNQAYFCGSVRVAQAGTVFAQTVTDGIIRSSDKGITWQNIGGPPGRTDSRTIACKSDNTIFAMDSYGSIWRTTNGGGFPIYTFGISTDPAFSTDTIGGLVSVPIRMNGLDVPRDLDFTLTFDTNLEYINTTSLSGMVADVPGMRGKNSARIHLPASEVNITGMSAYANFHVFADSAKPSVVTFSDLSVIGANTPCEFATDTRVTSTITGLSGCGIKILSDFVRYNKSPQFWIYPNPANSMVTIAYGEHTPNPSREGNNSHTPNPSQEGNKFEINVVDALGTIRQTKHIELSAEKNAELDLSALPSGIYFIHIRGEGILTALPISVQK